MNILQISTTDNRGGAASMAWTLKQFFDRQGIANSMFVRDTYSNDPSVHQFPGAFPVLSKALGFVFSDDTRYARTRAVLDAPEFKQADIVHCHNLHGYYFNLDVLQEMARTKKVVWTFHDMWPITGHCSHTFGQEDVNDGFFVCPSRNIYPSILFPNEKNIVERKRSIYRRTDFHVVTPSQWLADLVQKSVLGDKPLSVVYNGIDTSVFYRRDKAVARAALGLPQDKRIVLFVAKGKGNQFDGYRYVEEAVRRCSSHADIVFVSVGGSAITGTNVVALGRMTSKDAMAQIYSAADALLYPTLADTLPTVLIEASACGLPAVSFKTGGVPEVIEDGVTGLVVEYKNQTELQQNLTELLALPSDRYEAMSVAGVERVNKMFRQERMFADYMVLYERLLNSTGA